MTEFSCVGMGNCPESTNMLRIRRIYAYQPRSGEAGVFLDCLYPCSARAVSARHRQGTFGAADLAEGSDAERRTASQVSLGQGRRAPLCCFCRTLSGGIAGRRAIGRARHPAPHPDAAAGYRAAYRRQTAAAIAYRRAGRGGGRDGDLWRTTTATEWRVIGNGRCIAKRSGRVACCRTEGGL